MEYLKRIDELKFDGNLAENWRVFSQNWEQFAAATEIDKKNESGKIGIFLNSAGTQAVELFNSSLDLTAEQKKNFDKVYKAFEDFCKPKKNEMYESFIFWNRVQRKGEKFDEFLIDIKKLVKTCGYDNLEDRMVKDRIVLGVADKNLQRRMIEVDNLTLTKAIEMARSEEVIRVQSEALQMQRGELSAIRKNVKPFGVSGKSSDKKIKNNAITNKNDKSNSNQNKIEKNNNCKFCSRIHDFGNCPAIGKICQKCGRPNHFAICCHSKNISEITGKK